MRNIKLEKNLIGKAWWKGSKAVEVSGVAEAQHFPASLPEDEKEKIIQSWNTIAIFETSFPKPFQIAFFRENEVWILKFPIETLDGKFGMRIGKHDIKFFAIDSSFLEPVQLSLVEITNEDNPRYSDLPLY